MPLPDLESLACVDALARTLRFHAAAKSRFLSPAAFSKRIQQVEDHVGNKLFARTTRTVELTPAGAALLPRLRSVLAGAEGLSLASEHAPVRVTLGTRHELGMSWLLPARRELMKAQPHLSIDLRFGSTDDLERAVLSLRVDAIVTSHPPSTTRLDAIVLGREDYLFVASPRLLKKTPFERAEHAAAHTLVDAHDDLPLFSYLRSSGLSLRFARVVTLGTIDAIKAAVLDGEGAAVLPSYFVAGELKKKTLATVLPKVKLGHDFFRLVFRSDDVHRASLEAMAKFLARWPLR